MKKETRYFLMTFLAGFMATVLGIVLTFGIDSHIKSQKRAETAKLLAVQITENMELVDQQVNSYLDIYNAIDSAYTCVRRAILADTLDRVKHETTDTMLVFSLSEYAQLEVDNNLDTYKVEILNTIGDVDLIGYIDTFYLLAQQFVKTSSLVIEQKQKVLDAVFTKFDISDRTVTPLKIVRFLHELPEYKIFYSRLLEVRSIIVEIEKQMKVQIDECKKILKTEKYSYIHSKLVKAYSILVEIKNKCGMD